VIFHYNGRPVEAQWRHWRVSSVSYVAEEPYFGWWLNGREPGVVHVQFVSHQECHHIPRIGDVYSELLAENGSIITATLGEDILYDHRDDV
jgi:hypothetical protein